MPPITPSTSPLVRVLFLSDLDGTWLSKDRANTDKLNVGVQALHDEFRTRGIDFEWGYVTARPPERVASEKLPAPAWTITYNGGSIQQGGPGRFNSEKFVHGPFNPKWDQANSATGFDGPKVLATLKDILKQQEYSNLKFYTIGQEVKAPAADACPYMNGLCFQQDSIRLAPDETKDSNNDGTADVFDAATFKTPAQIQKVMGELSDRLKSEKIGFEMSPAYPGSGLNAVMFDCTSPLADKGHAVSFVRYMEQVPPVHFITAGDGGNDISMMRTTDGQDDGRRVIVVGGLKELYDAAGKLKNAILQPADMDCSLAVLDGLHRHLEDIAAKLGR